LAYQLQIKFPKLFSVGMTKVLLRIFVIFIANCIILSFPEQGETQSITVRIGHPRIFITPSTLPALRQRAATTHSDTYRIIKNWCDQNWNNTTEQRQVFQKAGDYDAGILRYALIYLLGEFQGFAYSQHSVNDYGDKAVSIMMDIISAKEYKSEYVAIAYDWVNSRMSVGQKQTVVNWFRTTAGNEPTLRSEGGYRFPVTPLSFYPGLAFYGDGIDDSLAQRYVNFIRVFLDDARAVSHESGKDGGHATGLCYAKFYFQRLGQDFYALVTATNLTINDTYNKYPYMNGFPTWILYGIQPGPPAKAPYSENHVATLTKFEDCGSWGWNVDKNDYPLMQTLRIMAHVAKERGDLAKAKWITWLINERFQAPKQDTTWDIIFNDRSIPAVSPDSSGLPKVKAFGWNESEARIDSYLDNPKAGLGHVHMKSSWDQGANTTYAVFKVFPYYYFGHQHFDSLAFSIFKGEPLALPNSGAYFYWYEGGKPDSQVVGYPHHYYYYKRDVANNCLLIMDPNEVIKMRDRFFDGEFKDGGQRDLGDVEGIWGSVKEGSLRDWGGLIKHEDTKNYTYSSGDATKGYNSVVNGVNYLTKDATPKVTLVQRDFVYLKSSGGKDDYFVVFDRIDSTSPSFRKVFLLHTVGEPKLNGSQSTVYGGASGGLYQSDNTNIFTITQTKAKLFLKSLMPSRTKVYKMGGKTTTYITQPINDTDGTKFQGPKINISVNSTAELPDKPVVVIDNEAFMCDGKASTQITGCIRGKRYYKNNYPQVHNVGAPVIQQYAWMIRETDTDSWIAYPHDYGEPHSHTLKLSDCDDYGRWAIRIETVTDEIHTNFLNILHPTVNMSKTSMSETTLIDAGNMAGCLVKDNSNPWVIIFSKTGKSQSGLTYQASYSGDGKHLVTGLENGLYDIYRDGIKIYTKQTTNQNTLYFESNGGQSFQIVKTKEREKTDRNPLTSGEKLMYFNY
jgi:hypothetical protein